MKAICLPVLFFSALNLSAFAFSDMASDSLGLHCSWQKGDVYSRAHQEVLATYSRPMVLDQGTEITASIKQGDLILTNKAFTQYPITANENCNTHDQISGSHCFYVDGRNAHFEIFIDRGLFEGTGEGRLVIEFDPSGDPQFPSSEIQRDTYSCGRAQI